MPQAKKTKINRSTTQEKREEKIREKAYELFEKSGLIQGRDMENWLEAERIISGG